MSKKANGCLEIGNQSEAVTRVGRQRYNGREICSI